MKSSFWLIFLFGATSTFSASHIFFVDSPDASSEESEKVILQNAYHAIVTGREIEERFFTHDAGGDKQCPFSYMIPKGFQFYPPTRSQEKIEVPFWVTAAVYANWGAFDQLVTRYPFSMADGYRDDSFCKVVAQAKRVPYEIVKKISEMQVELVDNPFGEIDSEGLFPLAYLSVGVSQRTLDLFIEETEEAGKELNDEGRYQKSLEVLSARWVSQGKQWKKLPACKPFVLARTLVDEELFHGFDPYCKQLAGNIQQPLLWRIALATFKYSARQESVAAAHPFLKAVIKHYPQKNPENIYALLTSLKRRLSQCKVEAHTPSILELLTEESKKYEPEQLMRGQKRKAEELT